jgi:hypothetical protein
MILNTEHISVSLPIREPEEDAIEGEQTSALETPKVNPKCPNKRQVFTFMNPLLFTYEMGIISEFNEI